MPGKKFIVYLFVTSFGNAIDLFLRRTLVLQQANHHQHIRFLNER
jgi:hypothetical protein